MRLLPRGLGVVVVGLFLLGCGESSRTDEKKSNPPVPVTPKAGETVGIEVGQIAPEIEGEDIDGKRFTLSSYRGKVVVLDFWGHW